MSSCQDVESKDKLVIVRLHDEMDASKSRSYIHIMIVRDFALYECLQMQFYIICYCTKALIRKRRHVFHPNKPRITLFNWTDNQRRALNNIMAWHSDAWWQSCKSYQTNTTLKNATGPKLCSDTIRTECVDNNAATEEHFNNNLQFFLVAQLDCS